MLELTALLSTSDRAIATFLTFMFHMVVQRHFQEVLKILYVFCRQFIAVSNSERIFKFQTVDDIIARIQCIF